MSLQVQPFATESPRTPAGMGHAMLWVDEVTVSFDGFRALDKLSLVLDPASCAASSARTAPARPR